MTAVRGNSPGADDALLDAIGRRLAAIDEELPRLAAWRPDRVAAGQLHVVRGRTGLVGSASRRAGADGPRGDRRSIRLEIAAGAMAAALAVAVLATNRGAVVGRPAPPDLAPPPGAAFTLGPGPSVAASVAMATPTSAVPTPVPTRPGTGPRSTPHDPGQASAPTPADGVTLRTILGAVDWPCGVLVEVALDPLGSGLIDKLAFTSGATGGYVGGDVGPLWIGIDPNLAARAFKAQRLVVDPLGSTWAVRGTGRDATVLQLVPERSRSGALAWRSADAFWRADCPPPGTDPKSLVASRSSVDWPAGRIVDLAIIRSGTSAIRTIR